MEKHRFVGKTKEEAIENAKIGLQELEENVLIVKEKEELRRIKILQSVFLLV